MADISVESAHLTGTRISGSELVPAIDEFPIICIAAAFAEGVTTISGAKELRFKESDRIAVMADSLKRLGIKNNEMEDGIRIEGAGVKKVKGNVTIESRGDHRIAMSLAVAALNTAKGITIGGAASVDVSFPGFFHLLEKVSVR